MILFANYLERSRKTVIAFANRQLTGAEQNYTTTEREALDILLSVKKYWHYHLLNKMVFYVDHVIYVIL